jgi:formate dehydrogenase iron-sulfur subunit
MYVLHHADKPEIYANLPKNPTISPLVELWKGTTKYAGLAVMGVVAALGVLHYVVEGPNSVSQEDEKSAERLIRRGNDDRV